MLSRRLARLVLNSSSPAKGYAEKAAKWTMRRGESCVTCAACGRRCQGIPSGTDDDMAIDTVNRDVARSISTVEYVTNST